MVKFYGQRGEDCVLWSVFPPDLDNGIFLDVGALDGKRFSNTYSFECEGWKGICVEAHPYYIPYIQKNRPNSIVVHAAVSDKNKEKVEFYANDLGSLSTLDASMQNFFKSNYRKNVREYKKIFVPMRTVDSILEENRIDRVHVVSIDVEGTELAVLKGFNLQKYKPRVLVVEALDKKREVALKSYMKEKKYFCPRRIGNNLFFCCNPKDRFIINSAKVQKQIHTDHPLKGK